MRQTISLLVFLSLFSCGASSERFRAPAYYPYYQHILHSGTPYFVEVHQEIKDLSIEYDKPFAPHIISDISYFDLQPGRAGQAEVAKVPDFVLCRIKISPMASEPHYYLKTVLIHEFVHCIYNVSGHSDDPTSIMAPSIPYQMIDPDMNDAEYDKYIEELFLYGIDEALAE